MVGWRREPKLIGLIFLAANLSVAGCATVGNLPTHKLDSGSPAALHTGTLVREGECLLVVTELPFTSRYLVVWPPNYSLVGEQVIHGGTVRASVGASVRLGGGEYKSAQYGFVETLLATDVPPACRDNNFWLATSADPVP